MARTNKVGIDYFPFDVDFFSDEKIEFTSARFGIKGEIVAIRLLCKIYRNGYYTNWNEDEVTLFAKRAGDGITPSLVNEIVNELVKRGFFEKSIFDRFKILTSNGIQKRYFEITKRYKSIDVIKEFLLINIDEMINVNIYSINADIKNKNDISNPQIEIEKEIEKEIESGVKKNYRFLPPSLEDIENYFSVKIKENKLSMNPKNEAVKFEAFYSSKNWFVGKNKMTDWKKAIGGWIARSNSFDNKKQLQTYSKPDFSNKFQ